jgi:2-polyprenyl-3-methyl-5-hydroxy-6-metoxy-1,4-benzoquinol methylase
MRDSDLTRRYFDRSATSFDSLYVNEGRLSYYLNSVFRRALYERVEITINEITELRGCTLLDVGCGSGRNSVAFLNAGASRVVGIDFAEAMLALARQYTVSNGVSSHAEFICGDAVSYPFFQSFDVVVALGVFDYISDPRELLRRMVCLSNHKVIASFPCYTLIRGTQRKVRYWMKHCPVYFQSPEQLNDLCKEVGLDGYRLVPCGGAGQVLIGRVGFGLGGGQ